METRFRSTARVKMCKSLFTFPIPQPYRLLSPCTPPPPSDSFPRDKHLSSATSPTGTQTLGWIKYKIAQTALTGTSPQGSHFVTVKGAGRSEKGLLVANSRPSQALRSEKFPHQHPEKGILGSGGHRASETSQQEIPKYNLVKRWGCTLREGQWLYRYIQELSAGPT